MCNRKSEFSQTFRSCTAWRNFIADSSFLRILHSSCCCDCRRLCFISSILREFSILSILLFSATDCLHCAISTIFCCITFCHYGILCNICIRVDNKNNFLLNIYKLIMSRSWDIFLHFFLTHRQYNRANFWGKDNNRTVGSSFIYGNKSFKMC